MFGGLDFTVIMFCADECTFSDISEDELVSASQLVEEFVCDADLWNCSVSNE